MTSILFQFFKLPHLPVTLQTYYGGVRFASKKASSGARWQGNCKLHPKRRGVKAADGEWVQAGFTVVKQRLLHVFPGLNVGFGICGNLYAMVPGKVIVSCEKANVNWDHNWVKRLMSDQNPAAPFYKTYYNVIPKPEHNRFKLVERV